MSSERQRTMSAVCSNCGGQLEIDGLQETVECPYCGTSYVVSRLLNESDTVRAERIKSQAYKEVENEKIKFEEERRKREEEKIELDKFKKSKFSKVLIIFTVLAILLCLFAFSSGRILAGILAVIITGLLIVSYLMGLQVIREKRKGIHILIAIIAFILFIPYFKLNVNGTHSGRKSEQIEWTSIDMHEFLPEPKSNTGNVWSNSSENLSVDIEGISNDDYIDYVNQCETMGYTLDKDKSEMDFDAYNEKGYKLNLFYYKEHLSIKLDAPRIMNEFQWPDSGPGSMLPVPKSNQGEVSTDNSEQYSVYVGGTSTEEYKNYVKLCSDKGFNVDYNNTDKQYSASNAEGYELTLSYEGFDTMKVSIHASENEADSSDPSPGEAKDTPAATATPKPKKKTKKSKNDGSGVSPEFKKAMDSYEDFFDEYIAFMKKYEDSDDALGMYTDYLTYLEKYTDMVQKISEINQSELSAVDAAYYLKVYNRIMKKISDAEK